MRKDAAKGARAPKSETVPVSNPRQARFIEGFLRRLRRYFLTGLVVAAPLGITLYLTVWFIDFADGTVRVFLPPEYHPENLLPVEIPGLGLMLAVGGLILLGALVTNFVGRAFMNYGEQLLGRMPIVRTLYGGLKQIFETALSGDNHTFRQAALLEYPRKGIHALVFVTMNSQGEVARKLRGGKEVIGVFLPTTPNPTSGFLLFVPEEELILLDMDIEDAAKMIVSAGILEPPISKPRILEKRLA